MPAAGRIRVPTSERIHTAEKAAEPDKLAATRPFVKVWLKNGTRVEGPSMRFAEGVYTVKQAESLAEIREADIWEITFVSPRSSSQGTSSLCADRLAFLSQPACVQDLIDAYHSLGPKAATEMGELLTDSDPQVRRMAAQAISNRATRAERLCRGPAGPVDQSPARQQSPVRTPFPAPWPTWENRPTKSLARWPKRWPKSRTGRSGGRWSRPFTASPGGGRSAIAA